MPLHTVDSITRLTRDLVRIPTRSAVDSYDGIFACLASWLNERGVESHLLHDASNRPLALAGEIPGGDSEEAFLVNATVDTASFGDEAAWTHPPTSATVEDGWLYGRGSADCKAGVAIFCHVVAAVQEGPSPTRGLAFVFDADEHNGSFGGLKAFLNGREGRLAGAMLGYPGNSRIIDGARGFWRAVLRVGGRSVHSGSSRHEGSNAVGRASRLVEALELAGGRLAVENQGDFPLPPKMTVTGIRGGGDFSMVPDVCEIDLDIRLTPDFAAEQAEAMVREIVAAEERGGSDGGAIEIELHEGWPAYRLPADSRVATALQGAATEVLGFELPRVVAGPSNVGNLLSCHSVEATCGFGVNYRNIHAVDECLELTTIGPVYETYRRAVRRLIGGAR